MSEFDYLKQYIKDDQFDIPRLIHDDFYVAIKLCYNAGKYISSAKLLMSFIDTMGFIKYGNDSLAFRRWLDDYVNLLKVGITSTELWEQRNSLLHMSTLDSRKVQNGQCDRLIFYVGGLPNMPSPPSGEKWYNLNDLMSAITEGLGVFIEKFINEERMLFIERYDQILSDHRYAIYTQDV